MLGKCSLLLFLFITAYAVQAEDDEEEVDEEENPSTSPAHLPLKPSAEVTEPRKGTIQTEISRVPSWNSSPTTSFPSSGESEDLGTVLQSLGDIISTLVQDGGSDLATLDQAMSTNDQIDDNAVTSRLLAIVRDMLKVFSDQNEVDIYGDDDIGRLLTVVQEILKFFPQQPNGPEASEIQEESDLMEGILRTVHEILKYFPNDQTVETVKTAQQKSSIKNDVKPDIKLDVKPTAQVPKTTITIRPGPTTITTKPTNAAATTGAKKTVATMKPPISSITTARPTPKPGVIAASTTARASFTTARMTATTVKPTLVAATKPAQVTQMTKAIPTKAVAHTGEEDDAEDEEE